MKHGLRGETRTTRSDETSLSLDGGEHAARDGEQQRDEPLIVADHLG